MSTDTDALKERIARALYENAEYYGPAPTQPPWDWRDDEERGEWTEVAAAVLPIVAVEVRAAKAEALREAAGDIVWSAETLPHMTPHDAARGLVRRAERIETGASDDRR